MKKEYTLFIKEHCVKNNLDYTKIKRSIQYQYKYHDVDNVPIEDLIIITENRYREREKRKNIKYLFNQMEKANSIEEYRFICKNLKINWKHVRNLSYYGYNIKNTILLIWFFGDIKVNGYRDISRSLLFKVKGNKILNNNDPIYCLIAYYKCGITKYLEDIYLYENKYLESIVNNISKLFNLSTDKRKELISEGELIILELLQRIVLNNIQQIIVYIKTVLYGRLIDYAKKNFVRMVEFDESYMY